MSRLLTKVNFLKSLACGVRTVLSKLMLWTPAALQWVFAGWGCVCILAGVIIGYGVVSALVVLFHAR